MVNISNESMVTCRAFTDDVVTNLTGESQKSLQCPLTNVLHITNRIGTYNLDSIPRA